MNVRKVMSILSVVVAFSQAGFADAYQEISAEESQVIQEQAAELTQNEEADAALLLKKQAAANVEAAAQEEVQN